MHTQREAQTHTTSTSNNVHTQHTNNVHNNTHKQPLTQYTSTSYAVPQGWAWYSRAIANATASTHYSTADNEAHSSTAHTQQRSADC